MADASTRTPEQEAEYQTYLAQEILITDVTEMIVGLMQEAKVTRLEMARRLGKSKGFVSHLLSGQRNMTLRTLADLVGAVEHRVEVFAVPCSAPREHAPALRFGAGRPADDAETYAMWLIPALYRFAEDDAGRDRPGVRQVDSQTMLRFRKQVRCASSEWGQKHQVRT